MALVSKVLSCFSKSWIKKEGNRHLFVGGMRHCSGSSVPSPQLPVEEIENIGSGPCLMFADAKNDVTEKKGGEIRHCFSFSSGKSFSLPAPQLQGRRCWGTQYGGWVVTLGLDRHMHLFNPLTQQQLSLPSQRTFQLLDVEHDWFVDPEVMCSTFIKNFSLSSSPSDFGRPPVIMSIYGACYLAFASPGDKAWKSLKFKSSTFLGSRAVNFDILFYKGDFYSINSHGELCICDITSTEPKEKPIASFQLGRCEKFYLVDISGDLHLICRMVDFDNFNTESFDVYRFDFNKTEWIGVQDFKSHALFVGNNTTFAISAFDYPEVKPNCIYFTDDHFSAYSEGFCDMGVYDFENRTLLQPFHKGEDSLSKFARPFFFMPSPLINKNTN